MTCELSSEDRRLAGLISDIISVDINCHLLGHQTSHITYHHLHRALYTREKDRLNPHRRPPASATPPLTTLSNLAPLQHQGQSQHQSITTTTQTHTPHRHPKNGLPNPLPNHRSAQHAASSGRRTLRRNLPRPANLHLPLRQPARALDMHILPPRQRPALALAQSRCGGSVALLCWRSACS